MTSSPYHPIVRPAGHAAAVASFSWFMQGDRELAAKYAAELDDRERVEVLLAVCRFAATLFPPPHDHHVLTRDGSLLASGIGCRCDDPDELLKHEDTVCAYCGRPDCADRWDHDRLHRGSELTWWKWSKK